ncbi:MAG: hypothetical protein HY716_15455 [Planctomycetes bacterium]|nr:hypothetical protein [Planctomycetota bacterium]
MTTATILACSDVRGDLSFLARVLELAARSDVNAQAVFIHGGLAGPLLTSEERQTYLEARSLLEQELHARREEYEGEGIRDIVSLCEQMTANPERYRRKSELSALRTVRVLVGLKSRGGKLIEKGRAALRARRLYEAAELLFRKSRVPVYALGDTSMAEEWIHPSRFLHFATLSVSDIPIRALAGDSADDPDFLPELSLGARRAGQPVDLDAYPLAEGRVLFTPHLNPMVHELLKAQSGKLVITCGDGSVDFSYPNSLVSSQAPSCAYVYRFLEAHVSRSTVRYERDEFGPATGDDFARQRTEVQDTQILDRRQELEDRARLAGFGQELIRFIDLMRRQNPELAAGIENSQDRVEVILKYVRQIEGQLQNLNDVLGAERAGKERLIRALAPWIGEAHAERVSAAVNLPPDEQFNVASVDAANVQAAKLIIEALSARGSRALTNDRVKSA